MKKILVNEATRPELRFCQIKLDDGTLVPGSSYWSGVVFICEDSCDKISGSYYNLELQWKNNLSEIWEFKNAKIMMAPESLQNKEISGFPYFTYIMTFDEVIRK